jgi:hypothetical protein
MALLFAATNIAAYAICAKPGLSTVTLPDGSSITIRLVGDEHAHYTLSEDNHLLLDNEGFYQYATLTADGKIVASSVTAHDETFYLPSTMRRCCNTLRLSKRRAVVAATRMPVPYIPPRATSMDW